MASIYSHKHKRKEGLVINITSLAMFLEIVNKFLKTNRYIYRGINNLEQKYPKIIRNDNCFSLEIEHRFLRDFEKYYGLYNRVKDCWEFIALAQHHGLETRLIDFTTNPFVAAFFSLYNPTKGGDKHIIYVAEKNDYKSIEKINYNPQKGYSIINEPEDSFADIIKYRAGILNEKNATTIMEPNYANSRVFFQQGLFLVPGIVSKDNIDMIYNKMPISLIIENNARTEIMDYLSKNGFDEFRLMPDLSSVCLEINRLVRENK